MSLSKTSRPPHRRVDLLGLVRRCYHEDILLRTTIQVSQELVDFLSLVLLVTSQSLSRWNECFELVDEYHGGGLLRRRVE